MPTNRMRLRLCVPPIQTPSEFAVIDSLNMDIRRQVQPTEQEHTLTTGIPSALWPLRNQFRRGTPPSVG